MEVDVFFSNVELAAKIGANYNKYFTVIIWRYTVKQNDTQLNDGQHNIATFRIMTLRLQLEDTTPVACIINL